MTPERVKTKKPAWAPTNGLPHAAAPARVSRMLPLVLAYAALIIYGSLYPFTGWRVSDAVMFGFIGCPLPEHFDRADLLTNVLVYMPIGLLLALWLTRRRSFGAAVLLSVVAGTLLSFAIESTQQFLPARVASQLDLLTNMAGTLLGALLAGIASAQTFSGRQVLALRNAWVLPGSFGNLGLAVLGMWALSQTSPLVPSIDVANLRAGLAPLWRTLNHPEEFDYWRAGAYALYIAALGVVARTIGQRGKPVMLAFVAFAGLTLLYKVPVVSRQLSLEAMAGAVAATVLLLPLSPRPGRAVAVAALACLLGGFALSELAPGPDLLMHPFNWIPFWGQMETLSGLADLLELFWPFVAAAYFVDYVTPVYRRLEVALLGMLVVPGIAFAFEWYQQFVPGRYGDLTPVLLAIGGWLAPWWVRTYDQAPTALHRNPQARHGT
jgi:VanZ family protein